MTDGAGERFLEEFYPHRELRERIIGAAMKVHRTLGRGFLESFYENALAIELAARGHGVRSQVSFSIEYKGKVVGVHRVDLLVDDKVVLELKSVEALASAHTAQLRSTLKAAGKRVGLLMNFNQETLKDGLRRVIN